MRRRSFGTMALALFAMGLYSCEFEGTAGLFNRQDPRMTALASLDEGSQLVGMAVDPAGKSVYVLREDRILRFEPGLGEPSEYLSPIGDIFGELLDQELYALGWELDKNASGVAIIQCTKANFSIALYDSGSTAFGFPLTAASQFLATNYYYFRRPGDVEGYAYRVNAQGVFGYSASQGAYIQYGVFNRVSVPSGSLSYSVEGETLYELEWKSDSGVLILRSYALSPIWAPDTPPVEIPLTSTYASVTSEEPLLSSSISLSLVSFFLEDGLIVASYVHDSLSNPQVYLVKLIDASDGSCPGRFGQSEDDGFFTDYSTLGYAMDRGYILTGLGKTWGRLAELRIKE